MTENPLFDTYNGRIEDLFIPERKYTFLVGAGASMDSPTNMPSAREIVRSLLSFCAPNEEVDNLLSLDLLRYELVVEKIQGLFDENLKFMDYLELVDNPNINHMFLANLIARGDYVITTNFDYLIEHALLKILPEDQHFSIYPIITKDDYLSFQDPIRLIESEKYPIYKIHGSKRNIITGANTAESLITTISSLGKEREEGVTFAIEPYKKPTVYNLMKDRILVIIGYSGSDDFDIGPLLKELPFLSRLIWIEHTQESGVNINIVKKEKSLTGNEQLSKTQQLLAEISSSNDFEVFLIRAHTGKLINNFLWNKLLPQVSIKDIDMLKTESEIPGFSEWIEPFYKNLPITEKYRLACQLLYSLKQVDDTLRCSKKGKEISEEKGDSFAKSIFLNFLGMINQIKGNYNDALEEYQEAFLIDEQTDNLAGKTTDLNNIGSIYLTLGKYDDALKNYEEALKISDELEDLNGKTADLNNIGRIHEIRGQFELALARYEEALRITEELGDLGRKSALLNNIGMIHNSQGNLELALNRYEESLKIAEQLGDLYGKIILLNNIGRIYDEHQNFENALKYYEMTIQLTEQLGDLSKMAGCFNNIGSVFLAQEKIDAALEYYKKALKIEERLGDPLMKAIYLNNIGMIYDRKKEFKTALNNYDLALKIVTEIGDEAKQALFLTKVASDYMFMQELNTALKNYELAIQLFDKLNDNSNKAATLSNIGRIYESQEDYNKALEIYEEAFEIDKQIGDPYGAISDLNNIGRIYETIGDFHEALTHYEGALQISTQIGQNQYIEMIQKKITELERKIN
jgi:tetratricopeptide (TPR) repeat protein